MDEIDLSKCAEEEIHIPGFIQPHGYCIVYNKLTNLVTGFSSNAENPPKLDENIISYLGKDFFQEIASSLVDLNNELNLNSKTLIFDDKEVYIAVDGDEIILEFMINNSNIKRINHYDVLKSMRVINQIHDFDKKLNVVASEFKNLTGIDRVMIYKFDDNYNGQVISESKEESLNSFLGLFFPESDIPKQARKLYLRKLLRTIPNVNYKAVDLVRNTEKPLNLGDSYLRSVSPIHIEYLKNMGVNATLTISIIVEGRLWGLIACHHYSDIYFSLSQLEMLENFAENVSQLITYEITQNNTKFETSIETTINQININSKINYDINVEQIDVLNQLMNYSENIGELFESTTFAIFNNDNFHSKNLNILNDLRNKKDHFKKLFESMNDNCYSTINLTNKANFEDLPYPGCLVFKIGYEFNNYYLVWFKSEFKEEIKWGGDPSNKATLKEDGTLSPRNSFDAFVEKVDNKSKPWNENIFNVKDKIIDTFNNFINHNFKIKSLKKLIDKHIMSLRLDLDRNITNVSNAFLETLGVDEEEITNTKIDLLLNFETGDTSFKNIIDILDYQNTWEGELKFVKADKSILFCSSILAYEYNSSGDAIGMFLITYDITERKKLAVIKEINHILNIWQQATEQTGDGLLQFDLYKQKLSISHTLIESLGYTTPEIYDINSWYSLFHPDDYQKAVDRFEKLKNGLSLKDDLELRLRHKNGSYVWFIEKSFIFNSEDKSLMKIVSFYTNYDGIKTLQITQQKKIEEKKEEFESIFKTNKDGIVLTDLEGNILSYNDSFQKLLGYEEESLNKKNLVTLTILRDQDKLKDAITKIKTEMYSLNMRKSYNTNFDKILNVEETIVLMPDENRVLFTIKDISQNLVLENSLKEAKITAEKANEAKSQFLANMSHEIRTPMNGIINLSKILVGEDLDEDSIEYAKMIYSSSSSLLGILNDILDLSKIEAGKIEIDPRPENIEDISKSIENIHSITAKSKDLLFQVDISEDLPKYVLIDRLRVQQILSNIIGNAIKFTDKGIIHIIFNKTEIDGNDYLEFMIRDTGIGIDSEIIDKILNPFEQADLSTTRKYGGTGLGLSITSKLIELMNGKLDIYSKVGVGSTFTVTIPLIKVEDENIMHIDEAINDAKEVSIDQKSINILLAEDDKVNQIVFAQLFKDKDYNLAIVNNGEEFLEAVISKDYDLILMDNDMPKMGGKEATVNLRKENFKNPILAVSASVMEDDIASFIDSGMNAHIAKPIEKVSFFKTIESFLLKKDIDFSADKKSILVAEDDLIGQTIISKVLENLGYKCTIANDGLEVLKLVEQNSFDLILMDLHMPKMDGFEASEKVRQNNKDILIITLSSSDTKEDMQKAKEVGMNEHISKPIKKDIIKGVLEKYL